MDYVTQPASGCGLDYVLYGARERKHATQDKSLAIGIPADFIASLFKFLDVGQ
jgi:hypothetical protein